MLNLAILPTEIIVIPQPVWPEWFIETFAIDFIKKNCSKIFAKVSSKFYQKLNKPQYFEKDSKNGQNCEFLPNQVTLSAAM